MAHLTGVAKCYVAHTWQPAGGILCCDAFHGFVGGMLGHARVELTAVGERFEPCQYHIQCGLLLVAAAACCIYWVHSSRLAAYRSSSSSSSSSSGSGSSCGCASAGKRLLRYQRNHQHQHQHHRRAAGKPG
jgi:hypothetical protein